MAENKAKRSIHLAQPERLRSNPEPAEVMPVKAHVYRTLAELNGGFEKVIQDFNNLQRINFFRTEALQAAQDLICAIRAQVNRDAMAAISERETANAGHFDRMCSERGFEHFRIPSAHTTRQPAKQ